jgi:AcrR family transcriptional regulator
MSIPVTGHGVVAGVSAERGSRVLDAAGELLGVHGYRRVTVEDVARRAGVGKGTVYLHWPSKLELFASVLVRESVGTTRGLLDALRADPAEALLSRALRRTHLDVTRRPLMRAFHRGDVELLGALVADSKTGMQVVADKSEFTPRYLGVLHHHGLLLDDPARDAALAYRLAATTRGFFLLDHLAPAGSGAEGPEDARERADALETVVRRAFEPPGEPDPAALAAAAPLVAELYEQLLAHLVHALPEEEP